MLRRFKSQQGAVSTYMIIVTVPIFLFVTLFIDFARIKAAELETEQAMRAGVRSVLSAYHPALQPWGLYGVGVDTDKMNEIFSQVLIQQLSANEDQKAFHYSDLQYHTDSERVIPMYMLGNHTVFEQQILEEMKYRAPIEFALEITDKLQKKSTVQLMKNGSVFSKEAEKTEKLIQKREKALDEAWSTAQKMHQFVIQRHAIYIRQIERLRELASLIGSHTVESVTAELDNLPDDEEDDEDKEDSRQSRRARLHEILGWINEYASSLASLKLGAELDYYRLSTMQKDIDEAILRAKKANDELRIEVERLKQENGSIGDSEEEGSDGLAVNSVFDHIKIYDDSYFSTFQSGVASVVAMFAGFRTEIEAINLYIDSNYEKAIAAADTFRDRDQEFYQQQSAIEQQRQKENDNIEGQKKQQRQELAGVLNEAKSILFGSCDDSSQVQYDKLEGKKGSSEDRGLFGKYMQMNQEEGSGDNGIAFDLDDGDKSTSKSMNLLGDLADLLLDVRDELYLNEYALTKFNYRTFGMERTPDGEPKKELSLNKPGKHRLPNQEVEYLIYGFSTCKANMSSAYSEMFAIRLAIRIIEELLDTKNELLAIGSPLLVLLTAAAKGAVKAYKDMTELTQGKAVPISSKLTGSLFTFTYKDYLRLFLFLHTNNVKLMSRMQGLIELNTDVDLAKTPTYVEATVTTSSSLWFTSGLMKLLQLSGSSQCIVNGNRCEIVKTAALAYE